jgi:CRISPR-associated protein Csx17
MRASLEPVTRSRSKVRWAEREGNVVWSNSNLDENLAAIMIRRSVAARAASLRYPAIEGRRAASLDSVAAYLNRTTDDRRVEECFRALALLDWLRDNSGSRPRRTKCEVPVALSRAYALLKQLFVPWEEPARPAMGEGITHEPRIIPLLRADRVEDALEIAQWRLRASGLVPLNHRFHLDPGEGIRLAGALLIPIDLCAARALAELVLHEESVKKLARSK